MVGRIFGKNKYPLILIGITITTLILSGFNLLPIISRADDIEYPTHGQSGSRANDEVLMEKGWSVLSDKASDLAWGDLDNDGHLDLAVAQYNNNVKVFKNRNGSMDKLPIWKSSGVFTSYSVSWGDMDADGYPELAVGNGFDFSAKKNTSKKINVVFKNFEGDLGDNPYWYSGDRRNTSEVLWADIDNDGDMDLTAANFGTNGKNVVYQNSGDTLKTSPWWTSNDESWTEALDIGDINNDGYLDLVTGNNYGQAEMIYFNNNGNLEKTASWENDDIFSVLDIAFGDIDNDGDLDIVAGTTGPKMCIAYFNNGGTYAYFNDWSLDGVFDCTGIGLGDVDSDGDLDLALGCKNNGNKESNYIHLNLANTIQSSFAWKSSDQSATTAIAFADIDNDGDLDLGAVNNGTFESITVYSNGADILPPRLNQLPSNPAYASITTPKGINYGTIQINYTLYDAENDPVKVEFQYSIDDSQWKNAVQWTGKPGDDLNNMATSPSGKKFSFYWDTSSIKKESKNVIVRLLVQEKQSEIGIYRYSTVISYTKSFSYGKTPSVPIDFSCTKITANSVKLTWEDNPTEELIIGYEIYINKTNSTSQFVQIHDEQNYSYYVVENLVENSTYYFKILAYDAVPFKSELSQRISCRTLNKPPMVKPSWRSKTIIIPEDGYNNDSLNLDEVFYDPTGDFLTFGVVEPNNFTINILGNGDVKLKPQKNWFGIEMLNFTADDGQGQYHSPTEPFIAWMRQEVVVESINDPPRLKKPLGTIQITEDPDNITRLNLINYFDDSADGDQLTYRVEGNSNVTIDFVSPNYAYITLEENWADRETIMIFASDGEKEIFDFLTIIGIPVNDVPTIGVSNLFWQVGSWENATLDIHDPDVGDVLVISTNIEEVVPGLIKDDNYIFNTQTGEIKVLVSKEMKGFYKFNITVNDGFTIVTKTISLSISSDVINGNGQKPSSKSDDDNMLLIIVIVIVIIVILAIIFGFQRYKKSQKISFMKCPECGQSVVCKGKGTFKCNICGTIIDPAKVESRVTAPIIPPTEKPITQSPAQTKATYGPEATQVSGGLYPKSILDGTSSSPYLNEDYEPLTVSEPTPKPTPAQPGTGAIPMAVPITGKPKATPASTPTPVPTPIPKPIPRPTPKPVPTSPQTQARAVPVQAQPVQAKPVPKQQPTEKTE
jgi:hypothetical protein